MNSYSRSANKIGISLEATVFICGALVMIFEINGSRILAPFLGTSTYIWTSLIGVILAALSLGYWLGGKLADTRPQVGVLASIVFAGGGLVSITILIRDVLLAFISAMPTGLEIKAIVAALLLFAPASITFGFVLPFSVKLRMLSLTETGKTVGRLYALSTLGSILGTFAAGFLLIPFVGSVRTMYLIAGTLFLTALILAPLALTRTNIASMLVFLIAVASNEAIGNYRYQVNRFLDIDTEYARLSIFETTEPRSGKQIRVAANDPHFIQSAIFLDNDDLVFDYNRFFHLAKVFNPVMQHSLMIGGAGYSFPRDYLREYQNATLDVVEIDPQMTAIAREHFRLKDDPRMQIFHEDARMFLRNSPEKIYDAIFIDAFGTLFSVPYHLTTIESMRSVKRASKDNAVLVMNLGGALSGNGSKFTKAEFATLQAVFSQVRIFKVNQERRDDEMQNLIIVAMDRSSRNSVSTDTAKLKQLLSHEYRDALQLDLPMLTDELVPVEYYNSFAQNSYQTRSAR